MVVRLKQYTLFVVQAFPQAGQANPEVTFNGQWLTEKISDNIDSLMVIGLSVRSIVTNNHSDSLMVIGLSVRSIVTNNHSTNVNAFLALKDIQFRIKLLYKAPAKQ